MSILIKGIKKPKSCYECQFLEGDKFDGLCHAASRWLDDEEYWMWYVYPEGDFDDTMPLNCPLIELPPHGRLIDADATIHVLDNCYGGNTIKTTISEFVLGHITGEIPPTIIEAEEGE